MLVGLALAGCSGDDGAAGPAGIAGPAGPDGPSGPDGNLPVVTAGEISITVTRVLAPKDGGAPSVDLTLTDENGIAVRDLPARSISFVLSQLTPGSAGGSSEWQSYVTRESAGIPDAQASTENGSVGTFVDNGDGTYRYTFSQALTAYPAGPAFDPNKTHRLGIEIRGQAPITDNGVVTFVPAGGSPSFTRDIVDNDTCNACHDRLEFHGGPRTDIAYCVTCHNPYSIDGDTVNEPWGGSVDMTLMIHKIHAGRYLTQGYYIVGFRGTVHDYSDVVFPQSLTNCETCHEESDPNTPQASNWRTVPNRNACGACHDNITNWESGGADGHPGGLAFTDDLTCTECHGPDSDVDGGAYRVANVHRDPVAEAGERFQFNIIDVIDTAVGDNTTVLFSVTDPTNDDAPYDIQNDEAFTTCQFGASRLAISIGWVTSDYTNRDSGNTPAQPVSMNPLTACGGTSTAEGEGVFSVTSPVEIPATVSGTLAVTIDGHPAVPIDGTTERIPVTNAIAYYGITDDPPVARRNAVAIERCDACHSQLTMHGNNRTDEPEVCVVCHNPDATDINKRAGACVDAHGADDASIDMKYMIHALHAFSFTGEPYKTCNFFSNPVTFDFLYPGKLNNCEGCHLPGGYYPVDPGTILGTTVSVGADLSVPTDDTVVSPNTSACSGCHITQSARNHMLSNGADYEATKAADSSLISSGVESCAICHGPGRAADVELVHGVAEFQFN